MSAKDQIKRIVDAFKKEPYLKDKTNGMAEGLMLGASLADEANERSKDAKETTLAVQEKYKEQILTQDLNPNKDPELVDIRDGSTTAGERIRKFEQETNRQLVKTDQDLNERGLNIKKFEHLVTIDSGIENWTEPLKAAIQEFKTNRVYQKIFFPSGIYHFTEGVEIDFHGLLIEGAHGIRFDDEGVVVGSGTSFLVHSNGDFIRFGNEGIEDYEGYHSGVLKNLHLKYVGNLKSILNNPTAQMYGASRNYYGVGARAIVDYQGGETLYENIFIENFEVGVYGEINDISETNHLTINYCKTAIECNNSPQNVFRGIYCIGNDTVLDIYGSTYQITFENIRLVKNGSATDIPIKIRRYSGGVVFKESWLEDHNREGFEMSAFIEIGKDSGDLIEGVKLINTTLVAKYTDYIVNAYRVKDLEINGVFGSTKKRLINFIDGYTRTGKIVVGKRIFSDGIYYDVTSGLEPNILVEELNDNGVLYKGNIEIEKPLIHAWSTFKTQLTPNTPTPIIMNNINNNYKDSYDSNGIFKAPRDGYYLSNVKLIVEQSISELDVGFNIDGSGGIYFNIVSTMTNIPSLCVVAGSVVMKLSKGQRVQLRAKSDTEATVGAGQYDCFMTISNL